MKEITITSQNWDAEVIKSEKPVLLDFWAPWCGPCKMLGPVVSEIAEEHDEIKVGKVNVDEESDLAEQFGVMSIPTMVFLKETLSLNHPSWRLYSEDIQMDYQIKKDQMEKFSELANFHWKKLALSTMGGIIPYSENINGIRFVDKTDFERGKIIMFRMEVWINKFLEADKVTELKNYLSKTLGCEKVNVKDIIYFLSFKN